MQESAKQRNTNMKINTKKTPTINLGKVEESNTKTVKRYLKYIVSIKKLSHV